MGDSMRFISNARTVNPRSQTGIQAGQWIQLAATIDGITDEPALYLNGEETTLLPD
jgi:hypothetical protein